MTGVGGDVLFVEAASMPGHGGLVRQSNTLNEASGDFGDEGDSHLAT